MGVDFFLTHITLLSAFSRALFTLWGNTYMAALSCTRIVSQTSFIVVKKPSMDVVSSELKKSTFICELTFLATFAILHEIILSYFDDLFVRRYVR